MNVNLKAIFHLSQLFVNHCLQHDQMGSILNITSQAAFHGSTTGHAHYAASKAGLGRLCYLWRGKSPNKNQCEQYRRRDHGYCDDP